VAEVLADEHVAARGLVCEVDHPKAGRVPVVGQPVLFSHTPGRVRGPSPLLGEHTREVLTTLLGLKESQIDALERERVI
jgi:crotonobetainyl-CoA:carnitine CoA-transferase CaiB-like acyl-CoA transferase